MFLRGVEILCYFVRKNKQKLFKTNLWFSLTFFCCLKALGSTFLVCEDLRLYHENKLALYCIYQILCVHTLGQIYKMEWRTGIDPYSMLALVLVFIVEASIPYSTLPVYVGRRLQCLGDFLRRQRKEDKLYRLDNSCLEVVEWMHGLYYWNMNTGP